MNDDRESPERPPKQGTTLSVLLFGLAVATSVALLLASSVVAGGLSYLVAWFAWGGAATTVGAGVAACLGVAVAIPAGIALYWLLVPDPDDDRSMLRTFAAVAMSVVAMMVDSSLVIGGTIAGGVIGVALFQWLSPGWAAGTLALVAPLFGLVVGILVGSPPSDDS